LDDNNFNFSDLSTSNITGIFSGKYAPQKQLPKPVMQESNGEQFLLAGDTLTGNEYKWYKDKAIVSSQNANKLRTDLLGNGKYYCTISNKKFSLLTLTTDTVVVFKSEKNEFSSPANELTNVNLKYNRQSQSIEVVGKYSGNIEVELFDLKGRRILNVMVGSADVVSVGKLPEGMYLVTLTGANQVRKTQKILIR
jgi:hypothetical protein